MCEQARYSVRASFCSSTFVVGKLFRVNCALLAGNIFYRLLYPVARTHDRPRPETEENCKQNLHI